MGIKFEDFETLKKGDKLVAQNGVEWDVLREATRSGKLISCFVRCPGKGAELVRFLHFLDMEGIYNEEASKIDDLNHPTCRVKKAGSD
jgi:hypothetical protein